MKIIHFSDPHAGALPDSLSAYFDKRIVGTLNYAFKRRFLHNMALMQRGVDYIIQEKPDVVVCTGDLTSTGQPREFDIMLEILQPLITNSAIKLLYVPGNHDSYVKNNRCQSASKKAFETLNMNGITLESLPTLVTAGECDFILVNECRPTNFFLSTGYLTTESSKKIEELCSGKKERPRIMIGHFPLRKKYSLTGFRHKIYGQQKVVELLNSQKIDLALCGHTHKCLHDVDKTGRGEVVAASITKTGDLNIIEYNKKADSFKYKQHIVVA